MKRRLFLYLTGLTLFIVHCSDSPQLLFPESEEIAQVSGYVSPKGVVATVYIVDATVVDSVVTDSATGYFRFVNVPYGSYQIKVVAAGYGILTEPLYISSSYVNMYTLRLKEHPSQISYISPVNKSIVNTQNTSLFTDTTAVIRIVFKERMDTASVIDAITVTPTIPWKLEKTEFSDPYYHIFLSLPIIDFFSYTQVTLTIGQSAKTIYGENLDFDFDLIYYPDTASLSDVIASTYISSTSPYNGSSDVNTTTDIEIRFRTAMNRTSVEQAFSITPTAIPNFFWSTSSNYEKLTVRFAVPLLNNTPYTVSLDSGMTTLDSTGISGTVSFFFTTRPMAFGNYTPLNGELSFPATAPFIYVVNFPVDSTSFLNAFSISPLVDSLSVSISNASSSGYYEVTVYHSILKLDTVYTITIDSTLQSTGGALYGKVFSHQFTTEAILSDTTQLDSSLVIAVSPEDTTFLINCSDEPLVYFKSPMDKQSVEQRLSITPATLFTVTWADFLFEEDRIVEINPSQRLRANTTYTIVIDSGYQTKAHIIGDRFAFAFKTEPIALMEYEPLNGQINVPTLMPVKLKFNTAIDTTSLLPNVTIVPALDSLVISYTSVSSYEAWYYIDHTAFLPDTTYTVTLRDSINDLFGVPLGRTYTISFTTGN